MPAEWKNSIDLIAFGRNAAAQEKGSFTEYGYLVESGDAWEQHFEGRDVPEDYRIMSYPQPTVELDAAPAVQAAPVQGAAPVAAAAPQASAPAAPKSGAGKDIVSPPKSSKRLPTVWSKALRNCSTASVTRNICASCQSFIITALTIRC